MPRGIGTRAVVAALLVVAAAAWLSADTLVLKDGRRVTGDLVAVRNGTIEFQERGVYNGQMMRVPRDEVRRIEFDDVIVPDRPDRTDRFEPARPGGGRPGGLREREVAVASNVAWTDTGIDVRAGQMVYFRARGEVNWGPGRRDGPQGERNSEYNAQRPIPDRPAAALIGRIGRGPDAFFIGDNEGPVRVRESGRLFLGINDDYLLDNRGSFGVTISY
jgi:hypothetical protein